MKAAWLLLLFVIGLAVAFSFELNEAAHVPDLAALQAKFGSLEKVVRGLTDDGVKRWLDETPAAFDTASSAWDRAIRCTKNLADNAALNTYGQVAHAKAVAFYAVKYAKLVHYQSFSDPTVAAKIMKDVPASARQAEEGSILSVKKKQSDRYGKMLNICFATQKALIKGAIADAVTRTSVGFVTPANIIAENKPKEVETHLLTSLAALETKASGILIAAVDEAASRAASMGISQSASSPFLNPYSVGHAYCGKNSICMHGGSCLTNNVCSCPGEWAGRHCTRSSRTCALFQIRCENGGMCSSLGRSWACVCPLGYSGLYCEQLGAAAPSTPKSIAAASVAAPRASASVLTSSGIVRQNLLENESKGNEQAPQAQNGEVAGHAEHSFVEVDSLHGDSRVEAEEVDAHYALTADEISSPLVGTD